MKSEFEASKPYVQRNMQNSILEQANVAEHDHMLQLFKKSKLYVKTMLDININ